MTNLSACSIRIEWVWPRITTNDNVVPPDYVVFEVNLIGESHWTEIGTADPTQTPLVTTIPTSRLNTRYQLRSRCVSNSRGAGNNYILNDIFTAYPEGGEIIRVWGGGSYLNYLKHFHCSYPVENVVVVYSNSFFLCDPNFMDPFEARLFQSHFFHRLVQVCYARQRHGNS